MTFRDFANNNIVLFDGAMGTRIQKEDISMADWGAFKGCNEYLNSARKDIIEKIHASYFSAGSNVVETNTFGAIALVLKEYDLDSRVEEFNINALNIVDSAKKHAPYYKGVEIPRFVALSMGPGTKLASLQQIDYDGLYDNYISQLNAAHMAEHQPDIYIIETSQDLIQIKAVINACLDMNEKFGRDIPLIVSFTVEQNNALLSGSDISSVVTVLKGYPIYALGMNCAMGPDSMEKPFSQLASLWGGKLYLAPNAGLPELIDGKVVYPMGAEQFRDIMANLIERYNIDIVGGCCGSDVSHISALRDFIDEKEVKPQSKNIEKSLNNLSSLFTASSLIQEPKPALIGERANATGSKAFREMLLNDDYDGISALCVSQENEGAHFIDLSLAYTSRDELSDYKKIVPLLNSSLMRPLMIDSTNPLVIEAALKAYSGKPIINSVNLEDGGKKLHSLFKLVKKHPACMVALTIDEEGMALTAERKVSIAKRIYNIWVNDYRFNEEDLIFDLLTFSIGSGDETLKNAAKETLLAIKELKSTYPNVKTTLGVSNVSFGLSPKSRQILNSVFLKEAVDIGLDTAIVHAGKVIPLNKLSNEDIEACKDLIYNRKETALDSFISHFADIKIEQEEENINLPPNEKLANKLISGDKSSLKELVSELLNEMSAEDILNNILLPSMQKVGDLFGSGEILLPFVLKSAEVMKESVAILEPHFQKSDATSSKGEIVLATVAGDVHDIGKNLVDIVMSNNGFHVHNLGIKVPVSHMIAKAKEVGAIAIGMSGLLVQSTVVMKENIAEIVKELPDMKILLGGAALTKKFVAAECAPLMPGKVYYCKNVFDNIDAVNDETGSFEASASHVEATAPKKEKIYDEAKRRQIDSVKVPLAPFLGYKKVEVDIKAIYKYLDKKFLFSTIWGYKNKMTANLDNLEKELDTLFKEVLQKNIVKPQAMYGYFKCKKAGSDSIILFDDEKQATLTFANSTPLKDGSFYNLADFFNESEDIIPLQLVTLGEQASDFSKEFFKSHNYNKYYMLHGLFTTLTEAFAKYMNMLILREFKISHELDEDYDDISTLKRTGKRYSFGYPLCPNLDHNADIAMFLNSKEVGVVVDKTTRQMHPEYSTSAFLV